MLFNLGQSKYKFIVAFSILKIYDSIHIQRRDNCETFND